MKDRDTFAQAQTSSYSHWGLGGWCETSNISIVFLCISFNSLSKPAENLDMVRKIDVPTISKPFKPEEILEAVKKMPD